MRPGAQTSWRVPRRATSGIAHSLVNGLGVVGVTAMHLWGDLGAEWACGAILALCGLWVRATNDGPPPTPPGAAGVVSLLVGWLVHR